MSKAMRTVVGVAAAVAIPFAAPMIATSIGMSAAIGTALGSATAGSVIGGALTGAALGAAKGAIMGEDVRRNALMGGIGGGVAGYAAAPSQVAARTGISASTTSGAASGVGPVNYGLTTPTGTGIGLTTPTGTGLAGTMGGGTGLAGTMGGGATAGTGLSGVTAFGPVDYNLAAGAQLPSVGLNPATAGTGLRVSDPSFFNTGVSNALATGTPIDYSLGAYTPPSTGLRVVSANPVTAETAAAGTTTAAPATTKPTTFTEALAQMPGKIAGKFNDPNVLADLTLRAAGQLAGSAIAGDGLSEEEQQLLNAQTEELRRLQQTDRALFEQRLEQAQSLIGESRYFDPEYFGLQRARRAQIAGARAKRAGLRGLEDSARQAEARRFDLATARDVGTSYDVGYGTGMSGRLQTLQAGINAMPQSFPSSLGEYSNLRNAYGEAAGRARQARRDIGSLFGSLTGRNT